MMGCDEARERLHPYIDGELPAADQMRLEAHVVGCRECERRYVEVREIADVVRGARPLYEPPPGGLDKLRRALAPDSTAPSRAMRWLLATAAAGALLAAFFWFQPRVEANAFTKFAADAHLRHVKGLAPLDVASSETSEVAAWLNARLPFHMELPEYPAEAGLAKPYRLAGARLLQFQNADVAYLGYEMAGRPISLLVARAEVARPAGREVYRSAGLEFHFSADRGLQLITWEDAGLVYALASGVRSAGAESCIICHGSAEERLKFENLFPAP